MVLGWPNTISSANAKDIVVECVSAMRKNFPGDLQSITITKQEKSGDFFVSIVTNMSLEDTPTEISFGLRVPTY